MPMLLASCSKSCSMPKSLNLFLTFSSIRFRVSGFIFEHLDSFVAEFFFLKLKLWIWFHSSASTIQLLTTVWWRCCLFFLIYVFGFSVKCQVSICVWNYVCALYSIPLINVSLFMPILYCFYYDCSVIFFNMTWNLDFGYL